MEYRPAVVSNRLEEVTNECQERGIPHQVLKYDREDPAGFGEMLTTACRGCTGRILIDISGMSRLLIVQSVLLSRSSENCLQGSRFYIVKQHYIHLVGRG